MSKSVRSQCILPDGRRVPFTIKSRPGEPHYFVVFRTGSNERRERSTRETSLKRAAEAAAQLIKEEYAPPAVVTAAPDWDTAIAVISELMLAQNLRQRTIDDYKMVLGIVREMFPLTQGPGNVSVEMAQLFKGKRMAEKKSAYSVAGCLNKLRVVWRKWLTKEAKLALVNPWLEVQKPKLNELEKRYIEPEEEQAFYRWLIKKWDGWQLPVLFFQLAMLLGCRILQLCSVRSADLRDGRLFLASETAKGRVCRNPKLADPLYASLKAMAGSTYLWESYSEQLATIHRKRKLRGYVKPFSPERLKRFLQNQVTTYCKEKAKEPGFRPFTVHDFRGTAMSAAYRLKVPLDEAAVAFACDPATIRKHYLHQNRMEVEDRTVALLFQARPPQPPTAKAEEGGENSAG